MKNLKLAVIGRDVSASLSPQIHKFIAAKLGYGVDYQKISVGENVFEARVHNFFEDLDGFNVTIPYKLSIIPFLEKTEGDASVFGAVNTVKTGNKRGYNTDGAGFNLMLKTAGIEVKDKRFLVLGMGGAGRSVAKKLLDGGAEVTVYNRSIYKAKAVAKEFNGIICAGQLEPKPYYAIVNATGVGMHQTIGLSPVDENILSLCEVAIDLIYEPAKSRFLQLAESLGKITVNGLAMLFYQAYYAECIFAGITADEMQAKIMFEEFKKEYKTNRKD